MHKMPCLSPCKLGSSNCTPIKALSGSIYVLWLRIRVGLLDLLVHDNSLKRSIAIPFFVVSSASLFIEFDIQSEKKSCVCSRSFVFWKSGWRVAWAWVWVWVWVWVWEVSAVCTYNLICRSCWIESCILLPLFSSLKSSSLALRISYWMICSNGINQRKYLACEGQESI